MRTRSTCRCMQTYSIINQCGAGLLTNKMKHVSSEWLHTDEGRKYLEALTDKYTGKRKTYSYLERPSFPGSPTEYAYKLFFVGRRSVGKSSIVRKFLGSDIPLKHTETSGIEVNHLYWPVKLLEEKSPIIFKLQLWEAGESVLKKFDYLLDSCTNNVDGVVFIFSFTDKGSWQDVPGMFSQILKPDNDCTKIVMGTKLDLHHRSAVSVDDIRSFTNHWKIEVLKITNSMPSENGLSELLSIASILNSICDKLYDRDVMLRNS